MVWVKGLEYQVERRVLRRQGMDGLRRRILRALGFAGCRV